MTVVAGSDGVVELGKSAGEAAACGRDLLVGGETKGLYPRGRNDLFWYEMVVDGPKWPAWLSGPVSDGSAPEARPSARPAKEVTRPSLPAARSDEGASTALGGTSRAERRQARARRRVGIIRIVVARRPRHHRRPERCGLVDRRPDVAAESSAGRTRRRRAWIAHRASSAWGSDQEHASELRCRADHHGDDRHRAQRTGLGGRADTWGEWTDTATASAGEARALRAVWGQDCYDDSVGCRGCGRDWRRSWNAGGVGESGQHGDTGPRQSFVMPWCSGVEHSLHAALERCQLASVRRERPNGRVRRWGDPRRSCGHDVVRLAEHEGRGDRTPLRAACIAVDGGAWVRDVILET
jgi:hypothetical protein